MIRDAAASFLADASGSPAVRKAMDSDSGIDEQLWQGIAGLGWCGIAVPEAFGGMGLGSTELVLILEQMGGHLACAPYFSSVALAANLLTEAGSAAAKKAYLPALASGELRATVAFDAMLSVKKVKQGASLSGKAAGVI